MRDLNKLLKLKNIWGINLKQMQNHITQIEMQYQQQKNKLIMLEEYMQTMHHEHQSMAALTFKQNKVMEGKLHAAINEQKKLTEHMHKAKNNYLRKYLHKKQQFEKLEELITVKMHENQVIFDKKNSNEQMINFTHYKH